MRPLSRAAIGLATIALAACGAATTSPTTNPSASATPAQQLTVQIVDANGQTVAVATLTPVTQTAETSFTASPSFSPTPSPQAATTAGVHFHVQVNNLAPGGHGFQIHSVGRCDPPSFASAGPIFNPNNAAHGFNNPRGPKAGDLPDLGVGTDHQSTFDFTDNMVSLDPGAPDSLMSGTGTSLIVTRDPDDQVSQPEGNAGPRIACGVISAGSTPSATPSPSSTTTATPSRGTPTPTPSVRPSATVSAQPSATATP